jgi:GNAT superfamily N-acetyltransferase
MGPTRAVTVAGEPELITTYLEMREPQVPQVTPPHRAGMLLRMGEPSVPFYRYLIEQGFPEASRSLGDDVEVGETIAHESYDVFVLYTGGVPSALFELDRRVAGEIRLVRFGVLEGFRGRGLGKYVLAAAVESAWGHAPGRVWTSAGNREDPRRLLTLQWAGFVPYETKRDRGD